MPTHTVILTGPARADLAEIGDYIAADSPDAATKVGEQILAALRLLANLPQSNRQVAISRRRFPVHRIIIRSYIAYYRIEADSVYILTIVHGKRRQLTKFE